jgi:hypothetical protein
MLLLGRILEHSGHSGNAAASYIGVVKTCPLDEVTAEVYERLAAIYVASGEPDAARKLYTAVVRFDPNREAANRALAALGGERLTTSPGAPAPSLAPPAAAPMLSLGPPAPARTPSSPPPSIPGTVRPLVLPPPPGTGVGSPSAAQAKLTAVHGDVDVLRELPLLAELSLDELRALQAMGGRRRFVNGEILIEQGREGENLFVILSGKVRVLHLADSGAVTELGELGYGAALGDMALVDSGPTSARVEAVGGAEAYVWPLAQLRPYLASHEGTALRILRVVSRTLSVRLRETNRRAAGDA